MEEIAKAKIEANKALREFNDEEQIWKQEREGKVEKENEKENENEKDKDKEKEREKEKEKGDEVSLEKGVDADEDV